MRDCCEHSNDMHFYTPPSIGGPEERGCVGLIASPTCSICGRDTIMDEGQYIHNDENGSPACEAPEMIDCPCQARKMSPREMKAWARENRDPDEGRDDR